ncbi:MAG: aldo/keto reductase [Candidatus Bathyarchaeia archaeon]
MRYRKFGSLDFEVSVLSLGIHRSLLANSDKSIEMIRYAIDHNVNYIDLGYPFMEYEQLVALVNKALRDYREKVKIAVTLPISLMNYPSDFDYYLRRQLQLLQTNRIDFCILGEFNREILPKAYELNIFHHVDDAIKSGQIDKIGFSFHDEFRFLRDTIEAYDKWSFCQFQLSFMDADHHPGISGIKYAAQRGLAVVVTRPFKGGRLLNPPESIVKIWESSQKSRSIAEWCMRWVWNHPEISTVVVEMSDIKQVLENVALADFAEPNNLTVSELIFLDQIKNAYMKLRPINCAACYCCMPCPIGIDVPRLFELYNDAIMYGDVENSRFYYKIEGHHAEACVRCGKCIEKCLRKIPIIEWLKVAHKLLS